jgi:SpoVK/Ycf46/Vps4 family AAA+-type ATPase
MYHDQGITCLFHGPPGTGKTLAAEAIGLETGKPLMVVNVAQMVSEYVGRTGKNIEQIFKEASNLDAIVVFDECEALFGARTATPSSSADRGANMDVVSIF